MKTIQESYMNEMEVKIRKKMKIVQIEAKVDKTVNYVACCLRQQKIVQDIRISNVNADKIVCRITANPMFLYPYEAELDVQDSQAWLKVPNCMVNSEFYFQNLQEIQEGELKIEVFCSDMPNDILGVQTFTISIQPYFYWNKEFAYTMPAFIQPDDVYVRRVVQLADEIAKQSGFAFIAENSKSKQETKERAFYIYEALKKLEISQMFCELQEQGQLIRPCDDSMDFSYPFYRRTFLDVAILYATCLEAVFLHPVIVLMERHAYVGVWLSNQTFTKISVSFDDLDENLYAIMQEEFLPIECMGFISDKKMTFEDAVAIGIENMPNSNSFIDIICARKKGIFPIAKSFPSINETDVCERNMDRELARKEELELLQMQAMSITVKSKILNKEIDDVGMEFSIETESFLKNTEDETNLLTLLKTQKKGDKIRELHIKCFENLSETGKTNLFLSVNELKWCQEEKSYIAPLYLCPAEISRNEQGAFQLHVQKEEIFFNPALKVLLMHNYDIQSQLLSPSPLSNYREQMKVLKNLVKTRTGWSVKENTAYLSFYQIPNEAISNGLKDESVISHEIVKGFLDKTMNWNNTLPQTGESSLGIYAFETDSSQNKIIASAFEQKAQMVVGPAGNGKTQTITNIMLEAVRRGEKVLFVSEMTPAMEVVNEKLKEVLDDLSHMMIIQGKEDIISQVNKNVEYIECPKNFKKTDYTDEIKKYRDAMSYIEQYYDWMKEKSSCEKSLEELLDLYFKLQNCPTEFSLDEACAKIPLSQAEEEIELFSAMWEVSHVRKNYAEFIRYDEIKQKKEATQAVQEALDNYFILWNKLQRLEEKLQICLEWNEKERLQELWFLADILCRCPVYGKTVEEVLGSENSTAYKQQILFELQALSELKPGHIRYNKKKEKLGKQFSNIFSKYELGKFFQDFARNPQEKIKEVEHMNISCDKQGKICLDNSAKLRNYMKKVEGVLQNEPEQIKIAVERAIAEIVCGNGSEITELAKQFLEFFRGSYERSRENAEQKILKNQKEFQARYPQLLQNVLFEAWMEYSMVDSDSEEYEKRVKELQKSGYAYFLEQVFAKDKKEGITTQEIKDGFLKAWVQYQIDKIGREYPQFEKFTLNAKWNNLITSEKTIRELLRKEIRYVASERMLSVKENTQEFGTLHKLIRENNVAVRKFFEETSNIISTLCPCMIMSPSAVAEYIPANFPKFDIVIIDEGSQMPLYDALIPISRGKRCIIFGDEKQLQPMEEFKKRLKKDNYMPMNRESVLTAAYITSLPRQMLRFHYRSEKEGLIAFSNQYYYQGNILTFPSCDTSMQGISYEFVEDGVYDKENTKANEKEAICVIEKIKSIYATLPSDTKQTVGVITLNIHQRKMVQTLLMQEFIQDSEFAKKAEYLVSIVNLESCQGKEWDFVILSPGFAYDKDNKFSMGFGALNKQYGVNRLNVMITRARKQMYVITSIAPSMLMYANQEGTSDFRDFLKYANGDIKLDNRIYNFEEENTEFTDRIANILREQGYQVHKNIGSSDFKVDIGVVSKENPNKYALGILLEDFHNTISNVHDREVIYSQNLERKGWNVYRLRKLNWYKHPQLEMRQIVKILESYKSGR